MSKRKRRNNNQSAFDALEQVQQLDNTVHDGAPIPNDLVELWEGVNQGLSSRDDNKSIMSTGFEITQFGLTFPDGFEVSLDVAKQFAEQLAKIESSIQWIYGDLLDRALITSDEDVTYKAISDITGYAEGTLRNFVGIARRFKDQHIRSRMPYYKHYQILYLNGKSGREIETLIQQVESLGWSTRDLQYYIETGQIPEPKKKGIPALVQKYNKERDTFEKKYQKADEKQRRKLLEIAEEQARNWLILHNRLQDTE